MEWKGCVFLVLTVLTWNSFTSGQRSGEKRKLSGLEHRHSGLHLICRHVHHLAPITYRLLEFPVFRDAENSFKERNTSELSRIAKNFDLGQRGKNLCRLEEVLEFVTALKTSLETLSIKDDVAVQAWETSTRLSESLNDYSLQCSDHEGHKRRCDLLAQGVIRRCKTLKTSLRELLSGLAEETDSAGAEKLQNDDMDSPLRQDRDRSDRPIYPMEFDTQKNPASDPDTNWARTYEQYFDTTQLDRYLRSCTDCVEQTNSSTCPLDFKVLEMKKWATQVQELLSFGCQRTGCRGQGRCCVTSRPPLATTVVQMTQMLKDVYTMMLPHCQKCADEGVPTGDSGASDWSAWGECGATGEGSRDLVRSRTRSASCSAGSGRGCVRTETESETCQMARDCCQADQWTPWRDVSACSTTCGPGRRTRQRRCRALRPGTVCTDHSTGRPTDRQTGRLLLDMETETVPCDNNRDCDSQTIQSSRYSWTPDRCDCRTRRARCEEKVEEGISRLVDDRFCSRHAPGGRNPPRCRNDALQCQECVTDCRGRPDGIYPSCYSCRRFVHCSKLGGNLMECRQTAGQHQEYDSLRQQCVPGVSSTCRLKRGIKDCKNALDGRYHTADGQCNTFIQCVQSQSYVRECPTNLEFDQWTQRCERKSETCLRQYVHREPTYVIPAGTDPPPVGDIPGQGPPGKELFQTRMGIVIGGVLWP